MAEELKISATADKAEKYRELLPQLSALMAGENDLTANLANVAAALKQAFDFLGWILYSKGKPACARTFSRAHSLYAY